MQDHPKIIGVIPARYGSKRLPGKVLLNIGDRAVVHWVYERAIKSSSLNELLVATDSEMVQEYCRRHGIPAMLTGKHSSGSDRLHEVMKKTDGDIYVNIQGDEPTIRADHIDLLLQPLLNGKSDVSTLKVEVDMASAENPNCVKVVTDRHGRALYFSRFPIPFKRNENSTTRFYKHIGLYGYTRAALSSFHDLPQSPLEMAEKLEQLRFLENGIAILVVETSYDTVGVDTEADLKKAAALLLKRNPPSVDQI